jgi:hypothetical protein
MADDLDDDDAKHNPVFREVGRITMVWAHIDTLLDYCNVILQQDFGGHPKWPELPRTRLARKIQFFRDCLEDSPALAASKDRGVDLADEIKGLSDDRHWIIHGAAGASGNTGLIRFVRTRMKGTPSVEIRHSTLDELKEFVTRSRATAFKLTLFLAFALLKLTSDQFDKARREATARDV